MDSSGGGDQRKNLREIHATAWRIAECCETFNLELSRLRLQKNRNYKYLAIFDPLITNRLLIAKGIRK